MAKPEIKRHLLFYKSLEWWFKILVVWFYLCYCVAPWDIYLKWTILSRNIFFSPFLIRLTFTIRGRFYSYLCNERMIYRTEQKSYLYKYLNLSDIWIPEHNRMIKRKIYQIYSIYVLTEKLPFFKENFYQIIMIKQISSKHWMMQWIFYHVAPDVLTLVESTGINITLGKFPLLRGNLAKQSDV